MKTEHEMKTEIVSSMTQREIKIDPDKRPNFQNLVDDYHLLENLHRFSKFCEGLNVPVQQMFKSLARAIGIQNGGKYSVLVYDYLLAIPIYPPTRNGKMEALYGEGCYCNMVCYKGQLFGVVVFPASEHVTFYFEEFKSYSPYVQQLIFTYGNKVLGYCEEKRALAFDFRPELPHQENSSPPPTNNGDIKIQRKDQPEFIQLQ